MIYYFDTNIFRRYSDGTIPDAWLDRFRDLAKFRKETCAVTPITIVELGSHLSHEESEQFDVFKKAIVGINRLCKGTVLPEPDYLLKKLIVGVAPADGIGGQWEIFCNLVEKAGSLDELVKTGIEFEQRGKRYRVRIDDNIMPKFREDYEAQFLNAMWTSVITYTSPGYKDLKKLGKPGNVQDPKLRENLLAFIDGALYDKHFYGALAERCGAFLLGDADDNGVVADTLRKLCAFDTAYRWILKKIIEAGYNFEKNKNDYADIHLLIYLSHDDLVFVTNDEHLRDKVAASCTQRGRIKTFDEALAELESV